MAQILNISPHSIWCDSSPKNFNFLINWFVDFPGNQNNIFARIHFIGEKKNTLSLLFYSPVEIKLYRFRTIWVCINDNWISVFGWSHHPFDFKLSLLYLLACTVVYGGVLQDHWRISWRPVAGVTKKGK